MNSNLHKNPYSSALIKYLIISYWSLFWLFNSLDKIIGGSHFLWVGRDRFAQFQKFFASAGLDSPIVANVSLVIAAVFEIFAFLFFVGALVYFIRKKEDTSRSWFFVGIVLTLILFTLFAIGDHIFGDRFELLEHTLFWFIALFSWVVFIRIRGVKTAEQDTIAKRKILSATVIVVLLALITSISIFRYNKGHFIERSEAVRSEQVGSDLFKFSFPFLAGSTVFENTIKDFQLAHPEKRIMEIYTVPNELRLKKADGLIFFIITENRE